MVVRHHQLDFAADALVFPGGKVDKSDYDKKLNQSKTVAEAINNAKNSNIVTVTPLIEKLDEGMFLTIPKEAGYGEIKEAIHVWVKKGS